MVRSFESGMPCEAVARWMAVFLGSVAPVGAVDRYWNAGTAGYADPSRWTGNVVPGAGDHTFVNNGGTVQIGSADPVWTVSDLRAAETAVSSGTYNQSGGTVNVGGWMRLGFGSRSTGNLVLSGGTLNQNNRMYLGAKDGSQASGGTGVLTISGGQLNQTSSGQPVTIGARNTGDFGFANTAGTVNHSAGTFSVAGELWLGNGNAGSGTVAATYQLGGTGNLQTSNWTVLGRGGSTAVMQMSGGSVTKSGSSTSVILGIGTTGRGTINQSSGVFTNTVSPTWFGESDGRGIWNLSGDAQAVLGKVYLAHGATSTGEFNLNGGTLSLVHFDPAMADPAKSFYSAVRFNGGTLKARANETNFLPVSVTKAEVLEGGAIIDSNGFNITFDRGLTRGTGAGGLQKKGTGSLVLSGQSTYTGTTSVAAGTLTLNGSINAPAPPVTGYHETIGVFSCASLTLGATATMKVEIDSGASLCDRVLVAGDVSLGASTLQVTDLGNVTLPAGTKLRLVEYSGELSGAFSNAPDGGMLTVGSNSFLVKYDDASAVTLSVPGMSYAGWSANFIDAAQRDPMADADGDGLLNLAEYALDGDPSSSTADGKMDAKVSQTSGGERAMSLTFPVREGAIFSGSSSLTSSPVDGVVYIVEGSRDLSVFGQVAIVELDEVLPGNRPVLSEGWEYRSFQIVPDPANPSSREFMRVRVSAP